MSVKLLLPISFCFIVNGQWSVPTESSSPLVRLRHRAS